MMRMLAFLDMIAKTLTVVAAGLLIMLIGITILEVISRYAFNAPTMWAFDVSNFLNGALFALGAAYTLQVNGHVRIDIFSSRIPSRLGALISAVIGLVFFLPVLAVLTYAAATETWSALLTKDRVLSSAWQPLRWPFLLPLAIGLAALWLQCAAHTIRECLMVREGPEAVR